MEYYVITNDIFAKGIIDIETIPPSITMDMILDRDFAALGTDPVKFTLVEASGDFYPDLNILVPGAFVSDKFKTFLDKLGIENIFYKPVYFVDKHLNEKFHWFTIFEKVNCVDEEETKKIPCFNNGSAVFNLNKPNHGPFVINDDKIGSYGRDAQGNEVENFRIIQLHTSRTMFIINEPLKKELEKTDMFGIKIFNTKDFDGWETYV